VNDPAERDSMMHDLWRESCNSWVATARWAQVAIIAGFVVLIAATFAPLPFPHSVRSWIRILSYAALMAGVVAHIRALDEFYMRLYVYSAAFAAAASSVILVAAYDLRWPLASQGFEIISVMFLIGFVYTFIQMRRP
jgi:hypothetical protein